MKKEFVKIKIGDAIEKIDRLLDERKHDELNEYLTEFPALGHHYIEYYNTQNQLNATKINLIALSLSYILSK